MSTNSTIYQIDQANKTFGKNTPPSRLTQVLDLALITFFAFFEAFATSPQQVGWGYDSEFFRYIGMVIDGGGKPYVDVFDHKPPLIYLFAAFSQLDGFWGFWILERLVVALAAGILYLALRRWNTFWPLAQALLFLCLLNLPMLHADVGFTRIYTACFNTIAFLLLSSQYKQKYLISGVLAGLVVMMQQNEVLPLLGWLLWVSGHEDKILVKLARFMIGAVSSITPIILWLVFIGAFQGFIEQAYLFNFTYISAGQSWPSRLIGTGARLAESGLLIPALLALGLATATYRKTTLSKPFFPAIIAFTLQIFTITLSGKPYGHYYYGLVPLIILLFSIGLTGWVSLLKNQVRPQLTAGFLVIIFLAGITNQPYFNSTLQSALALGHLTEPAVYEQVNDEYRPFLTQLSGQKGQLLVWRNGNRVQLNTYFRITSPTRWIYTHFWNELPGFDSDGKEFRGILQAVEAARTRYIVDYSTREPLRPELQNEWESYLTTHYSPVQTMSDGVVLWGRNPVAGIS